MALAESGASISVDIMVGLAPRTLRRMSVVLPLGSTAKQALDAAGVWDQADKLSPQALDAGLWSLGVWGRKVQLGHVLRDQDRIELVRPLIVDPKEARRVRYRAHRKKLAQAVPDLVVR